MDSIQSKIAQLKADRLSAEKTVCNVPGSLCNIECAEGRVLIALKYSVSPLEVTNVMKLDDKAPVAVYCIAVGDLAITKWLGREVVLDLSYGGKGLEITSKVTNNDKKLIDIIGGADNLKFVDKQPVLNDRTLITKASDGNVEFWVINIISRNQIGGILY